MTICSNLDDSTLQAGAGKAAGRIAKAMVEFEVATVSEESNDAQMRIHPDFCCMPHWAKNHRMQTVAGTPTFTRQADRQFTGKERPAMAGIVAMIRGAGMEKP